MDHLQRLVEFFSHFGYVAVFSILLLCGFGLPIPEDVTLVAGGIISGLGYTNVLVMCVVGLLGVLFGDGVVFTIGRVYGEKILHHPKFAKIITPERYALVQEKFSKYGKWVLFAARFMPGLRTPIFLTAGISRRVSFSLFLVTDGLAALISVPVWVYLGYYGANQRDWLLSWIKRGQTGIFVVLGVAVVSVLILYLKNKKRFK